MEKAVKEKTKGYEKEDEKGWIDTMREIKFRAWSKISKTMEYSAADGDISILEVFFRHINEYHKETPPVMQYIGIKDKNDNEIYEGDIVAVFSLRDPCFRSEVIKKLGAFGYICMTGEFITFAQNYHFEWKNNKSNKIEVIGNIYLNKELLNEI